MIWLGLVGLVITSLFCQSMRLGHGTLLQFPIEIEAGHYQCTCRFARSEACFRFASHYVKKCKIALICIVLFKLSHVWSRR
jgi:hypothetical protein